jgi:hypothetical protein
VPEAALKRNVILYLAALVVLIPIDFLFLGIFAKGLFRLRSHAGRDQARACDPAICSTWSGY